MRAEKNGFISASSPRPTPSTKIKSTEMSGLPLIYSPALSLPDRHSRSPLPSLRETHLCGRYRSQVVRGDILYNYYIMSRLLPAVQLRCNSDGCLCAYRHRA